MASSSGVELSPGVCVILQTPTPPITAHALPARQKDSEHARVERLDLAAQAGQGAATELLQDIRMHPLAMAAAGAEFAFEQASSLHQLGKRGFGGGFGKAIAVRKIVERERAVAARVAAQEFEKRCRLIGQPGGGQIRRQANA